MKTGLRAAILASTILALSACTAQYRNHGYIPSEDDLANVIVGVDSRDSVTETIGAPTTQSFIDESGYYYVRSRVRHFGMLEPEVINREIVAITFDSAGTVQNIERFGLEDGRVVTLSRRVTPVPGGSPSFLKKILSALGGFDPASALSGN
ncbi:outer membrane protein assembly factor BamE [Mesobacterium pallidum]|uniref:outer membrane protein assembly factor BamE n=1 Tax=Mesobacterium pallidum TaxID=2872037 RepID=UPI001EE175CC|nr:outer membrane protein assembly factor BamE [Mesobacterium pallidum]